MFKCITFNQLSGIHIFMIRTIKVNNRLNAGHRITIYKYIWFLLYCRKDNLLHCLYLVSKPIFSYNLEQVSKKIPLI